MNEESKNQDGKIKTSVSLSPYLYEWMVSLLKSDAREAKVSKTRRRFVSMSDIMTTALSELKGRMEAREELEISEKGHSDFEVLLNAYFSTPQGKKYLQDLKKRASLETNQKNTYFEYTE